MALTKISGPENWQDNTIRAKKTGGVVTLRFWGTPNGTYTIPREYRPEIAQLCSFNYNAHSGQISVTGAGVVSVSIREGSQAYTTLTYVT